MIDDLPDPDRPLRIGTRGSPLALAQAHETRARLAAAHGLPETAFEIVVIKTTGDRVLDRPLSEIGGKGLFTREIEDALLDGGIDIAVHSMKDMPTEQPDGLAITCYLPREDVRDAFVTLGEASLASLPAGAVVGTSSLRRRAQLRHRRPDLNVVEFRGNVQTRMKKLSDGVAEATFLAMAGSVGSGWTTSPGADRPSRTCCRRSRRARSASNSDWMTTAARQLLAAIHDGPTGLRLAAERAFLKGLDGSCQTPIGGLAELDGERCACVARSCGPTDPNV